MGQRQLTAPAAVISLAEAKAYLRLEANSPETAEDTTVTAMIAAATAWAEGVTRRAFLSQRWVLTLDCFPAAGAGIALPLGRTLSIQSVAYTDTAEADVTLTGPSASPQGTAYRERLLSDLRGLILPPVGTAWPAVTLDDPEAVRVTYTAGYGTSPTDVPAPIRQAILYRVADQYEHRGSQDGALTGVARQELQPYALREFE